MFDDAHFRAVRPDGELVRRRRAEGIRRRDRDRLVLTAEIICEFADGGRFAHAVHAHEHDDGGKFEFGRLRFGQRILDDVFQQIDDEFLVFEFFRLCLRADLFDDVHRRRDGDIRGNEDLFQLVVKLIADFIFGKQRVEFARNVVPRLF